MKRFNFQQDSLLRVKQQLKGQAEIRVQEVEMRLSTCRRDLAHQESQLDHFSRQHPTTNAKDGGLRTHLTPWDWIATSQTAQQHIAATKQRICELEEEKRACSDDLRKLDAEVEKLQTLKAHAFDEHKMKQARAYAAELDETAMRNWQDETSVTSRGNGHD